VKKTLALIAALSSAAPLPPSWPSQSENASATRLQSTVERFGDDLSTIRRGQVPAALLAKHANTIRTLRARFATSPRRSPARSESFRRTWRSLSRTGKIACPPLYKMTV